MHFEHKMGSGGMRQLRWTRSLAAGIGLLAVGIALCAADEAQHGEKAIACTNPVSGVTWQIKIDYDRNTVDSNPASISDTEITWRDATNGWGYTLDRKSGELTVILASATGGNFLHDRCKLDN
jgi:hypothetical protein